MFVYFCVMSRDSKRNNSEITIVSIYWQTLPDNTRMYKLMYETH